MEAFTATTWDNTFDLMDDEDKTEDAKRCIYQQIEIYCMQQGISADPIK